MRIQPGDIILAITINDMILSCHWFSLAVYSIMHEGNSPIWDSPFCQANAFLSIFSGVNEYLYNLWFCWFVVNLMKNALKGNHKPIINPIIMHGSSILLGLVAAIVAITTE